MANPKMWKVVTGTDCDRGSRLGEELIAAMAAGEPSVGVGGYSADRFPAGYDEESVAQVAAGEEDQSPEDWEGV